MIADEEHSTFAGGHLWMVSCSDEELWRLRILTRSTPVSPEFPQTAA